MNRLDELENRSIYITREAYSHFEKIAVLWSMGKDSTVLLALCRKAFPGVIPFPIIFRQKEEICLSYIRSVDQSKPWPTKSQHFKLGNAYINLETVVSHYCGMFYNKNSRFEPNHSLDLIETLNAVPEDSDEHHLAEIEFGAHYRGEA